MAKKILLFIARDSIYFSTNIDDFKKIVNALGKLGTFEVEIIDASKNPELAEKYKIDALPTIIINDKRYVGKPHPEKILEILNQTS